MKVAFDKLHAGFAFEVAHGWVALRGTLTPKSPTLVALSATLSGRVQHACDRCGEEIWLTLGEATELLISRGENSAADYEFFGGEIDLDAIAASEVELFKSGYFYCARCEKNENFEFNL